MNYFKLDSATRYSWPCATDSRPPRYSGPDGTVGHPVYNGVKQGPMKESTDHTYELHEKNCSYLRCLVGEAQTVSNNAVQWPLIGVLFSLVNFQDQKCGKLKFKN
uniref:Uncharacterized protein n=1 Tax=Romanomermis culicivorax TaxID=13658 RepID=A0A915IXH4_ROMCU